MATTKGNYQIIQKIGENEFLLIHPESDAKNVLTDIDGISSKDVESAITEVIGKIPTKTSDLINDGSNGAQYATTKDIENALEAATGGESASDVKVALNNHKADKTNPHGVTKAQVGLGNVDNTSDANKPVSTAQQAALDLKADKSEVTTTLAGYATKNEVAAEVKSAIDAVVDGADEAFDTLKEIADWISADETGSAALTAKVGAIETDITNLKAKDTAHDTAIASAKSVADSAQADATQAIADAGTAQAAADAAQVDATQAITNAATAKTAADNAQSAASEAKAAAETNAANITKITNGTTKVSKATAADKLATAHKISLSGDATGEVSFDGSADKAIPMVLANSGVAAGSYSAVTVDIKGRVTAGAQLIEIGTQGQTTPSANLAIGGLFFKKL